MTLKQQRSDRAEKALRSYKSRRIIKPYELAEDTTDLIVDLLHLVHRKASMPKLTAREALKLLDTARMHFESEAIHPDDLEHDARRMHKEATSHATL